MIEKCSIGNMSYNLQNITLILLMLILIIVIIYYLKNSGAKHEEIIEKYTTIDTEINNTNHGNHSVSETANIYQFPTNDSKITLRACQVHFNSDDTSKYEYKDDWKEINTIISSSPNDTPITVPVKKYGRDNSINISDFDNNNMNYSEVSRCFKHLGTNDQGSYKYKGNNLISYNNTKYVSLNNDNTKKYMLMEFAKTLPNNNFQEEALDSICSLNYVKNLGLSGRLYRLQLNNEVNPKIIGLEKINIDANNNHIFTQATINYADLLGGNNVSYIYATDEGYYYNISNESSSIINIQIYKFDRNLLCNDENILSYTTHKNKKLDTSLLIKTSPVNKLINNTIKPLSTSIPTVDNNTITKINNAIATYYNGLSETRKNNIRKINSLQLHNEYSYADKSKFLQDISNIIQISIINDNDTIANNLLEYYKERTNMETDKKDFIDSIDTKSKYITTLISLCSIPGNSLENILKSFLKYIIDTQYIPQNKDAPEEKIYLKSISVKENTDLITDTINLTTEPSITTLTNQQIYEHRVFINNGDFDKTNEDFNLPYDTECDILIVGGGGASGAGTGTSHEPGGGGSGGIVYIVGKTLTQGRYKIRVGKGGVNNNGFDSEITDYNFNLITLDGIPLQGKGGGKGATGGISNDGSSGGSGGGGCHIGAGGTATQGNTFWDGSRYIAGGHNGSKGNNPTGNNGGGGGGAGNTALGWQGGIGRLVNISGFNQYYGGGGGAGGSAGGKAGGLGGGGSGAIGTGRNLEGNKGVNNLGGGGGAPYAPNLGSQNGGSGIIIIRYKIRQMLTDNNRKKEFSISFKENTSLALDSSTSGLIAWYKLDGNGNDSSGNNKHLVNKNGGLTYSSDQNLNINLPYARWANSTKGADTDWALSPNINRNVPITFSFWFKVDDSNSHTIIGYGNKQYQNPSVQFDVYAPYLRIATALSNQWTFAASYDGILTNTWYHISYVLNSENPVKTYLYVNGVLRHTGSGNSGQILRYINNTLDLSVGNSGDTGRGFQGSIADIRIYNRVLALTEITELYNYGILNIPINNSYKLIVPANVSMEIIHNNSITNITSDTNVRNYNIELGNGISRVGTNSFTTSSLGFRYQVKKNITELNDMANTFTTGERKSVSATDTVTNRILLGNKSASTSFKKFEITYYKEASLPNINFTYHSVTNNIVSNILSTNYEVKTETAINNTSGNKIHRIIYTILFNANVSGDIYLQSNPINDINNIFILQETVRTTFNNLSDIEWKNTLLTTNKTNHLNSIFNITALDTKINKANDNLIDIEEKTETKIIDGKSNIYNVINIKGASANISNTISNFATLYNNISKYEPNVGDSPSVSFIENVGLNSALNNDENRDMYISYENVANANRTPKNIGVGNFNILQNANKYIYFKYDNV